MVSARHTSTSGKVPRVPLQRRSVPSKRSLASDPLTFPSSPHAPATPQSSRFPPCRLLPLRLPRRGPEFVLGEEEKDKLVEYMRTYERFGGLRVISYCIMSNHFHILVEVPQRPDAAALPDDAGLVAKVRSCLGDKLANDLEWQLELHRKQENTSAAEELRERWFGRMWDVSAFMKVLKQRFTQWFNGTPRPPRDAVGRPLPLGAGGRQRPGAAGDGRLHRPQSGPREDLRRSEGLPLVRLRRSGRRRQGSARSGGLSRRPQSPRRHEAGGGLPP